MKIATFYRASIFNFFIVLAATMIFTSCSKDDDNLIAAANISGSWKVSFYFDTGDETSRFSGYTFSFNTGGVLQASRAGSSINGTWSEGSNKLNIDFGTTPVLEDLNDDWLIVEKTGSVIKLKDDNPAQDDQLHFSRL